MRLRHLLIGLPLLLPAAAAAHPHEWVDVASEVLFDAKGQIIAVRHHWRFDEAFSAFAVQGLDTNGDGAYSPEELVPLAQENVESLKDFDFFTFVSTGDYAAGFSAPRDYSLDLDENRLTLHFTLPLAQPLFTKGQVLVQVYDPEYYIAFQLPSADAVRLVDAPVGCRLAVFPAKGPDPEAAAALATLGPEQRELPAGMEDLTGGIDNSAEVNCGGPTVAAASPKLADPQSAQEAVQAMAAAPGREADLSALPDPEAPGEGAASQEETAILEPPANTPAAAPGGWTARVAAWQTRFNRDLTDSLKALAADGSAFWWLGAVSFLYGIVHAAGPGHGKVVISSYLVANEVRLRRGVLLAFISALLQAVVAVGIVGLMAVILNMTSSAMTGTARILEAGSFALVAALGLYLLAVKGRQAWAMTSGGEGHPHHHGHVHVHSHADAPAAPRSRNIQWEEPAPHRHDACCGHHVAPAALARPGLAGAAAAVVSVGLRPCTGALVVLVFALAQGIFWAGVASTFLMALGTAITVAALAALAVYAKDIAARFAGRDEGRSRTLMLALEIAAALLITMIGAVLFAGALAA